jgi:hypothetical protein
MPPGAAERRPKGTAPRFAVLHAVGAVRRVADDRRLSLAASHTEGREAAPGVAAPHLMQQRDKDPAAAGPDRMSERDCPAVRPWLEYMLGILVAAYRELEDRVGLLGDSRGAKTAAIERFVGERISDEFTIADVRDASFGASDSLIGKVLARLRDEGLIEPLGTGRSAKWRRLRDAAAPPPAARSASRSPPS